LFDFCLMSFNPRAHAGRDEDWFEPIAKEAFQSTRPRGARHFAASSDWISSRFNPRAHAGRDGG